MEKHKISMRILQGCKEVDSNVVESAGNNRYIVVSARTGNMYIVKRLSGDQYGCNCKAVKTCHHILSVQLWVSPQKNYIVKQDDHKNRYLSFI